MVFKKRAKILVVDDEEVIRDFLMRLLSLEGLEVKSAENGPKAIEAARIEKFDIIFLDVRMPGMDGVDAFKELQKITPDTKFVIMTGYSLGDLLSKLGSEGARFEAIITKPFDINEIVTIIEDYIRQRYPEEIADVLIVETDDAVSNFFVKLFKNYKVTAVKTGREALALVSEADFDLILSDIALTDMNGVELYSRIQDIKPSSKIILTTGDAKKTEDLVKESLYRQVKSIMKLE